MLGIDVGTSLGIDVEIFVVGIDIGGFWLVLGREVSEDELVGNLVGLLVE